MVTIPLSPVLLLASARTVCLLAQFLSKLLCGSTQAISFKRPPLTTLRNREPLHATFYLSPEISKILMPSDVTHTLSNLHTWSSLSISADLGNHCHSLRHHDFAKTSCSLWLPLPCYCPGPLCPKHPWVYSFSSFPPMDGRISYEWTHVMWGLCVCLL